VRVNVNGKTTSYERVDLTEVITPKTRKLKEPLEIEIIADRLSSMKNKIKPLPGKFRNIGALLEHLNSSGGNQFVSFQFTSNRVVIVNEKENHWIKLNGHLPRILGFDYNQLRERKSTALLPVELGSPDQTMYLFSNLCENSFVENTLVPLLGLVHIQLGKSDLTHGSISSPLYMPVVRETLSFIQIEVKTLSRHDFPFSPDAAVVLTLHFKRI
jgi:hypothetical protein